MNEFTAAERVQYQRHLTLKGFGSAAQKKLNSGAVAVIGAGGLGCPALQYLVAAGVGTIGIVDDDFVEISNLQRQILFSHDDIGKPKAIIAAEKLSKSNPLIKVVPHAQRLTIENALRLIEKYDLVLDGTDNFASRYLINDACVLLEKPLIHGSINQFEGMVSTFNLNGGPTYRCLFPDPPDPHSAPTCAEAGVLGVLPGIIGSWQAMEVIKVLAGIGEPLSGKVMLYDALNHKSRILNLKLNPENLDIRELSETACLCSGISAPRAQTDTILEISEEELFQMLTEKTKPNLQLLDVREDWERRQARIELSIHQPLGLLLDALPISAPELIDSSKDLVVYCKAGIRSRMACEALQSIGFQKLYNLTNGMDGWGRKFPDLVSSG